MSALYSQVLHGRHTFRSLSDRARRDIERECRKVTDPEGDIPPRLWLYRPASQTLHIHDVPTPYFGSRRSKDLLADVAIPALVSVGGVTILALETTVWVGRTIGEQDVTPEQWRASKERFIHPPGIPMPAEDPERAEAVMLNVLDSEINEGWLRRIDRAPGRRPRYGLWEPAGDEMPTGRILAPIREALR